MIRVEVIREVDGHGIFEYRMTFAGETVEKRSRQPLLDACRELQRMGAPMGERAGLFRAGKESWDASCSVAWGAAHTVDESGPRFRKWEPFRSLDTDSQ